MLKKAIAITALVFAASTIMSAAQLRRARDVQGYRFNDRIRKELVTLPYYGVFDNLAYQVNGGTVVLYGQVVRPSTKKDAERRVASIEGVERVVNRIEVLPLSPFDDSIRRRVYQSVFSIDGLYRYAQGANPSIHIIVKNGHVTLEGVVSNRGDSQLAYMAARQVPGVFSVTNHLRVAREG